MVSIRLQNKDFRPLHGGWAVAEKLWNLLMMEEVGGRLLSLQTGSPELAEAACIALWHEVAVNPATKAALEASSFISLLSFSESSSHEVWRMVFFSGSLGLESLDTMTLPWSMQNLSKGVSDS